MGNGFHQQPPFGAGPSAGQFGAPGHYGGAGTNKTSNVNNENILHRSAWEKQFGADPNYWIELSSVDPRSGNLPVKIGGEPPPGPHFKTPKSTPLTQRDGARRTERPSRVVHVYIPRHRHIYIRLAREGQQRNSPGRQMHQHPKQTSTFLLER